MEPLSKRELQVADLIHQGKIEKEIAQELNIAENTVHTHTKRIRLKLGARNIADITRIYLTRLKPEHVLIIILSIAGVIYLSLNPEILKSIKAILIP